MPADGNSNGPADLFEIWEQWYDTTSKAWSKTMNGNKETTMDPYGFYRTWMKSVGDAQEQLQANPFGKMDPREAWKRWLETSTDIWRMATERGADPLGLTTQWLEMMEEARARILAEGNIPADPFTLMKQWYDATSETWATVVGDIIGTERFMESSSKFLESYTSFYKTFRRANEEFFGNLQLPTRSDIARVAELVIEVEDKVEQIEDAIEDFEDTYSKFLPGSLDGWLEQVEMKINALPAALQKLANADSLEKRMDRVESKLDTLLLALEKLEAREPSSTLRSTSSTLSKPQETKHESSKVKTLPVETESA